jgi:ATP-dependent DNA helicase RecQ
MPAAYWDTFRLGARIPSLDSLVSPAASVQIAQLQQALSSVASIESHSLGGTALTATEDALFVGRLLLGLLCRGWPTFSSPDVEQALLASISPEAGLICQERGPAGNIGWRLDLAEPVPEGTWDDAIRGALLRGDRRLSMDEATVAMLADSKAEQRFYRDHLTPLLGNAIGWLELQRPLASMVREDASDRDGFGSERVDFVLDLPGSGGPVKLVVELDGPHHHASPNHQIDQNRDQLLRTHGWQTRRVHVNAVDDGSLGYLPGVLNAIIQSNPFPFTHIEDDDQLLDDPRNREAARLILTPHAVARTQLALCRGLMSGALDLLNPKWVIAVVERDAPCAELAVRDWLNSLRHLCQLYGIEMSVERVCLLIAEDHWADFSPVPWGEHHVSGMEVLPERLANHDENEVIDLAVDVSVGCHPTRRYPTDPLKAVLARRTIILRTAQRQSGYLVESWPDPRSIVKPLAQKPSLKYFLQTLFRKQEYREGQLPIIDRVLRREDVIGLLPTGAGKSITFQLPALLSPGLTLVIDPIKSLMQDQVENLATLGVMDAIQINSDTTTSERSRREWQFSQGEYRLVFISPERLQIQKFRDLLAAAAGKRPVAFVVVDEAHCVSEWGHDFRTAYLNLGRIAKDFCGHAGGRPPIVALTGTASEPVLRDIQRELEVAGNDAIVRPSEFDRDELKFEIVPVLKDKKHQELARLIDETIPERLGADPDLLASGACGGIVFCPHVNGRLGVFEVAAELSQRLPRFASREQSEPCPDQSLIGFYSGEPPRRLGMAPAIYADCKTRVQRAFKAGHIPLLVATSAFGMGIDKPNIRYTIHFAMAKSVEAFAQEAGRAGRDDKKAVCAVLFTDNYEVPSAGTSSASLDCLELDLTTEEAQARSAAAGWDGDDAEMQMYLHTRSYQGILRESAAVRALYHHWIEPKLPTPAEREGQVAEIAVSEEEYRRIIENLMTPMLLNGPEQQPVKNDEKDDDEKAPRPDLQRLIYRLSLLGIVSDYTVSYSSPANVYTLSVRAINDEEVRGYLFRYVERYLFSAPSNEVKRRVEDSPLEDHVCRCIEALCWFVYEEIEQRRRQSMRNMRVMLRESSDGEDLARRINEMLSNTALTQAVFDVLEADDYRGWARISKEINATDSAEHVYYQCLRALEDAPGHPGLLLLVALALQGMEEGRRDEVVSFLLTGLREVRKGFSSVNQRSIASWTIQEFVRIAPSAAQKIINLVVRQGRDSVLAGTVLRSMDAGSLDADPVLQRTSRRCLLKTIDERLHEFMNA